MTLLPGYVILTGTRRRRSLAAGDQVVVTVVVARWADPSVTYPSYRCVVDVADFRGESMMQAGWGAVGSAHHV